MRSGLSLLTATLATAIWTPAALAADVMATSRIDAVTVFPSGAEVIRQSKLALAQGEHTVIFADLPAQALPGSIRVEGKAPGRLEIGSVDTRRMKLQRADSAALAAERKAIEDDIERTRDLRTGMQALIETAQTQKTFITNLAELPKRPAPAGVAGQPARPDEWSSVLALIGSSMGDVQRVVLETQIKIRDTDRKIQDLEKKLAALAPAPEERTEVKVFITAGAALEADLTLTYQVPGASWSSLYDAKLSTGTKTAAPKLTLTRRAAIQQRTGEPWTEVRVALSTARPSASSAAPDLEPVTVDYEPERREVSRGVAMPPPASQPRAAAPMAGTLAESERADGRMKKAAMDEAVQLQAAQEARAQMDAAPFQAVFSTPGRLTIPNTGESKRVFVQEEQLDPALIVQTVPKLDAKAYLYAKMTMPRSAPYLPGPVSLFRDATFVGTGRLPLLSPGQEHELGFGVDDVVTVKYAVVDEKRGESGLITSSRTDQRNYRIAVKNGHERAVQLSARDQVPASLNQDIKVELTGRTQPTRRDIDDKRGILAWEGPLNPDEERVIEFGYRVTWPSGKGVVYGR